MSHPRIGTVLGDKYELRHVLGHGGMGEVFEARHRQIGRRVALKLLLPQHAADTEIVARFLNEARAAGTLEHENIAAVYDVGRSDEGAPYIVMEYLEGQDCDQLLEALRCFAPARALDLMLQVCRGLEVAHAHGIVHRDLKPANLFMTRRADGSDLVKILDFGIAKLADASERYTRTGNAVGTAYYMSPEQARGEPDVDARTDVYALGVILYELLSGERPFQGESLPQILHQIMAQDPKPLAQWVPWLPKPLCAVVHRAMAGDRDLRYPSVGELARAIAPFAGVDTTPPAVTTSPAPDAPTITARASSERVEDPGSTPAMVVPTAREPPQRSPLFGVLLAVILVALGATLTWLLRNNSAPEASRQLPPAPTVQPGAEPSAIATDAPVQSDALIQKLAPAAKSPPHRPLAAPTDATKPQAPVLSPLPPLCARLLERQSLGDALSADEQALLKQRCRR